ncbi:hypothetical protein CK203_046067 [Vitis vinifera]|uniref:Uncharacterized protein n=1 Tax=Vitis vinifera TaxID=29760 RepID=A0A438HP10_VITVI|nr:hypothetical protein CK203_046067 [Vitis vinifera]
MLRAPFLSKGKEKMRNIAIGEDGAGVKGFVGCSHSGSSVSDHPSYPANREKGLNFDGFCGMTEVEFFQSPSVPDLSISAFHSQFPMKNRVLTEICSKKSEVGDYRLGSPHGAPILGAVSQGDSEFSQMSGFQIEGLFPSKMAKVCEVLSTLDIKVYSRRKNRIATGN